MEISTSRELTDEEQHEVNLKLQHSERLLRSLLNLNEVDCSLSDVSPLERTVI